MKNNTSVANTPLITKFISVYSDPLKIGVNPPSTIAANTSFAKSKKKPESFSLTLKSRSTRSFLSFLASSNLPIPLRLDNVQYLIDITQVYIEVLVVGVIGVDGDDPPIHVVRHDLFQHDPLLVHDHEGVP